MERAISTQWVGLLSGAGTADETAVDAYLAMPEGDGDGVFPVVVVLQEIFGVNSHIRVVTERLARAGYVAIAPALYQRQVEGFECGYDDAGFAQGREFKDKTRADELLRDVQAAMDFGRSLPQAKSGSCGCIGFCFGGHVAYLAATLSDVAATAVFYGAGIMTWYPGGEGATVERTAEIQGRLWGFFGTEDPLIPLDQVDGMEEALAGQGVDYRVFRYPATHGFFCDQRESFESAAAADAWGKVLGLFGEL